MKKTQPRRQRIPKRGPGVAELEKILKEQEGRDSAMNEPHELSSQSFLFSRPNSTSFFNHHPPRPPPPTVNPSSLLVPWTPHLPFPSALPGGGDGGSGVPLSEKALFPITVVDAAVSSPPRFLVPAWPPPSMVNYIQGAASWSSSSSSGAVSAAATATARLFHQIEHPSSQRSTTYNYISALSEEEKMISAKRLRPFSTESHMDPNFHCKAPIFPNLTMKESSSFSSSMEMNHSALSNLDTNLRDLKRGLPPHLIMSSNYQTEDSNFISLGSVAAPPPPPSAHHGSRHEFAAFNFLPSQENMEENEQRAGGSGSDYSKTFNLLFQTKEKMGSKESSIGFYKETDEVEGDEIDLNLKL